MEPNLHRKHTCSLLDLVESIEGPQQGLNLVVCLVELQQAFLPFGREASEPRGATNVQARNCKDEHVAHQETVMFVMGQHQTI
eukprot:2686219-Amphidinium_carterae.1